MGKKNGRNMKKIDIKKLKNFVELQKFCNKQASFEDAWKNCMEADDMLYVASELHVKEATLIWTVAMCANTVRHLLTDKRSISYIDAAFQYAAGDVGREYLNRYATAAKADATSLAANAISAAARNDYGNFITLAAEATYNAALDAASDDAVAIAYAKHAYYNKYDEATDVNYYIAHAAYAAYKALNPNSIFIYERDKNTIHLPPKEIAIKEFNNNKQGTANICRISLTDAVFEKLNATSES